MPTAEIPTNDGNTISVPFDGSTPDPGMMSAALDAYYNQKQDAVGQQRIAQFKQNAETPEPSQNQTYPQLTGEALNEVSDEPSAKYNPILWGAGMVQSTAQTLASAGDPNTWKTIGYGLETAAKAPFQDYSLENAGYDIDGQGNIYRLSDGKQVAVNQLPPDVQNTAKQLVAAHVGTMAALGTVAPAVMPAIHDLQQPNASVGQAVSDTGQWIAQHPLDTAALFVPGVLHEAMEYHAASPDIDLQQAILDDPYAPQLDGNVPHPDTLPVATLAGMRDAQIQAMIDAHGGGNTFLGAQPAQAPTATPVAQTGALADNLMPAPAADLTPTPQAHVQTLPPDLSPTVSPSESTRVAWANNLVAKSEGNVTPEQAEAASHLVDERASHWASLQPSRNPSDYAEYTNPIYSPTETAKMQTNGTLAQSSEGAIARRNPQEDTPEFKNWFQGSKVVDEQGQPKVVYHGTGTDQQFDSFRTGQGFGATILDTVGSHFGTSDAANARLMTVPKNAGSSMNRIIPAYLKSENPFTKQDGSYFTEGELRSKLNNIASKLGVSNPGIRGRGGLDVRNYLLSKGYDGIPYRNAIEDKGQTSWISLKPENIKSAIGNRGTFDPNDPNILHQHDEPNAPQFYSQAQRIIESKVPNSATAEQMAATLRANGVKPDEMKFTGLDQFLADNAGQKVTKSALLDHMAENGVQVNEIMKGDKEAQYGSWQLPGGKNYREMLLTLPEKLRTTGPALSDAAAEEMRNLIDIPWHNRTPEQMERLRDLNAQWQQSIPPDSRQSGSYISSHWDEPNVLAHIRMNDRTGPNGEKILHVEEIQSDWHQAGRKEGYKLSAPEIISKAKADGWYSDTLPNGSYVIKKPYSSQLSSPGVTESDAWANLVKDQAYQKLGGTTPVAPFSKTWHELAAKRVLRYAAEHGYDKVSWTPGEEQGARYPEDNGGTIDQARTEGMKGFYDKMLPDTFNKLGKRFGARVGETELDVRGKSEDGIPYGQTGPGLNVHSIPITPDMRRSVLKEGQTLFQHQGEQESPREPKGTFTPLADGRAIINLFKGHDISTIQHELAHVYRRQLEGNDLATVENWAGVKDGNWETEHEEKFARGYESYLASGKAPTPKLAPIFARFKSWLGKIYNGVTGSSIDVKVTPEVRLVFDKWLGGEGKGVSYTAKEPKTEGAIAPITDEVPHHSELQPRDDTGKFNGPPLDASTQEPFPTKAEVDRGEYAANFNLRQFGSPQEVKDSIIESANRQANDIESQRRGRISWDETKANAAALGLPTVNELAKIKPGTTMTAEQVTRIVQGVQRSADNILKANADFIKAPTPENALKIDMVKAYHDMAVKSLAGGAAEAGRALQSFNMIKGLYDGGYAKEVSDVLNPSKEALQKPTRVFATNNKIVTRERGLELEAKIKADIAKARAGGVKGFLNDQGGALNIDRLRDLGEYGAYLIEGGLRDFTEWAAELNSRLGEKFNDTEAQTIYAQSKQHIKEQIAATHDPKHVSNLFADQMARKMGVKGSADFMAKVGQHGDLLHRTITAPETLSPKERLIVGRQALESTPTKNRVTNITAAQKAVTDAAAEARRLQVHHYEGGAKAREQIRAKAIRNLTDEATTKAFSDELAGVKEGDYRGLNNVLAKYSKSTWGEKFTLLRRAGLLSGPLTLSKIAISHVTFLLGEELARIPAALADAAFSNIKGGERVNSGADLAGMRFAAQKAAFQGVKEAGILIRNGELGLEAHGSELPVSGSVPYLRHNSSIGLKPLDAYVNSILRVHAALYHVMKMYAYNRALFEQATLAAMNDARFTKSMTGDMANDRMNLLQNPTGDMQFNALTSMEHATFINDNRITSTINRMRSPGKGPVDQVQNAVIDYIIPFSKVPENVALKRLDYTFGLPVGIARMALKMRDKGLIDESVRRDINTQIGRGTVGAAGITLGYQMYRHMLATSPNGKIYDDGHIWFDGKWRDIGQFAPVVTMIAVGAFLGKLQDAWNGNGPPPTVQDTLSMAMGNMPLAANPTVADQIASGDWKNLHKVVGGQVSSFIPTGLSQLAATQDSSIRSKASMKDYIENDIPKTPLNPNFNRQDLPATEYPETRRIYDPFNSSVNPPQ